MGCLPASRVIHGLHETGCISRFNSYAEKFNKKLSSAAEKLQQQLSGLKILVFDIFNPLHDLITSPSGHGFVEARKSCSGTGAVQRRAFLCNPKLTRACFNASQHVFWDDVHPSQAANQVLTDAVLVQGISLF